MDRIGQIADLAARLRATETPYPAGRFEGRGIVIAAGGAPLFTNAYVLISLLRRTLSCSLPIEVWHFGAAEMSMTMAQLLRELDVRVIDALPRLIAEGVTIKDGWQLKSFALNYSRFEEVLMLDADQVPVIDPAALFDWPQYRETGAVFWPDIVEIRKDSPIWAAMGLEPADREISFESGQVLVDKRQHWRALSLALVLNQAAEIVYEYIYGDKDTFLLAFRLANERYALVPHLPFRGDRSLNQRDFDGNLVFQHKTTGKWDYAANQRPGENARLFAESLAALEYLRSRWNGRVFHAPDRSAAARAAEAELALARHFRLDVAADDQRHDPHLELLPFGEIGEGRAPYRQNWWCESRGGEMHLLIRDPDHVSYDLVQQPDGSWRGSRFLHNEATATLLAAGSDPRKDTPPEAGLADALLLAIGYPSHTAADWVSFTSAVKLMAKVDPGFVQRLKEIARNDGESDLDGLLRALEPPGRKQLRSSEDVIKRYYKSTIDFDG